MKSENDRMLRAGDYVMGRMDAAERERAERDLERDPAFREAVMRFADRLRSAGKRRAAEAASADVWRTVEARIAELPQMRSAPLPPAARDGARKVAGAARVAGPRSFRGWRAAGAAGALLAACAAGYMAGRLESGDATAAIAILHGSDGSTAAFLEMLSGDKFRLLPIALPQPPAGKAMRLWVEDAQATGAVPLGTVRPVGEFRWRGPHLPPPHGGQSFRITLEDASGGVQTAPSGVLVAEGVAVRP